MEEGVDSIDINFANELLLPPSSKESLEEYFSSRVSEWRDKLRAEIARAGVSQMEADNIPVLPTGYRDLPPPGEVKSGWVSAFWHECLMRIQYVSIPAVLQVARDKQGQLVNAVSSRVIAERLKIVSDSVEHDLNTDMSREFWELLRMDAPFFADTLIAVIKSRSRHSWHVDIGTMIVVYVAATFAVAYMAAKGYWK